MADFGQNAKGKPFAKFSKWADFLAQISKVEKIENTCRILASLVWIDAEFILVFNYTKISLKYCVLAKKWPFLQRVLKMANFGQNAKGKPFAKFSKWADFLAQLPKVEKIENTRRILASLVWMDAEVILVSNDIKISLKYCVLAEKWPLFSKGTQNCWFRPKCKGGPFAKFSKWPIFLAEGRKFQKIGNTSPILA